MLYDLDNIQLGSLSRRTRTSTQSLASILLLSMGTCTTRLPMRHREVCSYSSSMGVGMTWKDSGSGKRAIGFLAGATMPHQFRKQQDILRGSYQQLCADPGSLANFDQGITNPHTDLLNNLQYSKPDLDVNLLVFRFLLPEDRGYTRRRSQIDFDRRQIVMIQIREKEADIISGICLSRPSSATQTPAAFPTCQMPLNVNSTQSAAGRHTQRAAGIHCPLQSSLPQQPDVDYIHSASWSKHESTNHNRMAQKMPQDEMPVIWEDRLFFSTWTQVRRDGGKKMGSFNTQEGVLTVNLVF
ncbi:hypothetical protein K438DRAFT_1767013 [Mycena galopus ATCC 62051]|nr:hypothetical protein K438DRAFT_1767013 [Mycena galopus ATCC 62051]